MIEIKDIQKRLREEIKNCGLTQKEIADYLFCDQSLYSKYERGLRDVPVSIIIKLAKYYNKAEWEIGKGK